MRWLAILLPLAWLAIGATVPAATNWRRIYYVVPNSEPGVNSWTIVNFGHLLDINQDRIVDGDDVLAIVTELDWLGAAIWRPDIPGDLDGDGDVDLDDYAIFQANFTGPRP